MLDILFSGPDEFERLARHGLGYANGLADKLNEQPPASKTAAEMDFMDLNLCDRDLCGFGGYCCRGLTILRRCPDINSIVRV